MSEHYLQYEIRKLQYLIRLRYKQYKIYTPQPQELEHLMDKVALVVWMKVDLENRFGYCSPKADVWPI